LKIKKAALESAAVNVDGLGKSPIKQVTYLSITNVVNGMEYFSGKVVE